MANKGPLEKKSGGVLGAIERIGNALPSPFILFLWLVVILVALTTVLAALGVSAVNPHHPGGGHRPEPAHPGWSCLDSRLAGQ